MEATGGPIKKRRGGADLVVVEGVGAMVQATWGARRILGPRISNERGRTSQQSMFLQCLGSSAEGLRDLGPWPATVLTDHHVAACGCPLGGWRGAARRDHP